MKKINIIITMLLLSISVFSQTAPNVLTTKTQTITNKTIVSPTLTGTPIAPTQTVGSNNNSVATTSFVTASISAASSTIITLAADLPNGGTTTNSTTVTGFTFTAEANSSYILRGVLRSGCSTGGGGSVFGVNMATGSVVEGFYNGRIASSDTYRWVPYIGSAPGGLSATQVNTTSSSQGFSDFYFKITTTTSGVFSIVFASKVNPQVTTIYAGSYMEIIKAN